MKIRVFLAALAVALTALVAVAPVGAQTTQNGLVNVSLSDITVQVPVGIAANVCDVTVGILANVTQAGQQTSCTAVADATAQPVMVGSAPAGSTTQSGLVNVALSNVTVQVPIAAAINLCGVNAAVLAVLQQIGGGANCTATSHSSAG